MPAKLLILIATIAEMFSVILAVGGYVTIIFCGFMMVFWFYVPILYSILICIFSTVIIFGINKILYHLVLYLRKIAALKS